MSRHLITREIGIDAGHRVTYHGSKCRNLHGHRYTIQATASGPLFTEGEQQGMVLDFGFLKDEMMKEIDEPCDHGMILWVEDPILITLVPALADLTKVSSAISERPLLRIEIVERYIRDFGFCVLPAGDLGGSCGKTYVVPFVPTAENLAKHWYNRLAPCVRKRTKGNARLEGIKVWETPNCSAQYPI